MQREDVAEPWITCLLIERSPCHRHKRSLSIACIDVRKAYEAISYKEILYKEMLVHRFPGWLCDIVTKLCGSRSTRIVATTKLGSETSRPIYFKKGIPQGDALCLRLFTLLMY